MFKKNLKEPEFSYKWFILSAFLWSFILYSIFGGN